MGMQMETIRKKTGLRILKKDEFPSKVILTSNSSAGGWELERTIKGHSRNQKICC
jgi:hypothetical protein